MQNSRLRAHLPVAGVRDGVVVSLGLVLAEDVAGDLEAVGGALSAQVALPRSSQLIRLDEDNVRDVCTVYSFAMRAEVIRRGDYVGLAALGTHLILSYHPNLNILNTF